MIILKNKGGMNMFDSERSNGVFCEKRSCKVKEATHWHDENEIVFVHSGQIHARMLDGVYVFDVFPGEIAVFRSCDIHSLKSVGKGTEITVIKYPSSFTSVVDGHRFDSSFVLPLSTAGQDTPAGVKISDLIGEIHKRVNEDRKESNVLRACIFLLCLLLSEKYPDRKKMSSHDFEFEHSTKSGFFPYKKETMSKFSGILEYINTRVYEKNISLDGLSRRFGLNRTHISELFPKLTQSSFRKYVATRRINRALLLLSTTDMNISAIAFECGFDTIRSFNNVFKSLTGTNPSSYLKLLKSSDSETICMETGIGKECFNRFSSNCALSTEEFYISSISKKGYCIGVRCRDFTKTVYTTLSSHIVFHGGAKHRVTFLFKPLGTENGFDIFVNFVYAAKGSCVDNHFKCAKRSMLSDGWYSCEAEMTVSPDYIPTVEDTVSIFSNPINDLGSDYLVADLKIVVHAAKCD